MKLIWFLALVHQIACSCLTGTLACAQTQALVCDYTNGYSLFNYNCFKIQIANCLTVDYYGSCATCDNNYYYLKDSNTCAPVEVNKIIENCTEYDSTQTCISCKSNYHISLNACVVVKKEVLNCSFYSSNGICSSCLVNYFLYNNSCVPYTNDPNCLYYSFNSCTACGNNLFYDNSQNLHGVIYSEVFKYEQFISGTALEDFTTCHSYTDPNCINGTRVDACTECALGYYLDSNSACVALKTEPVSNCAYYSDHSTCIGCKVSGPTKYYLFKNECIPFPSGFDNCLYMVSDSKCTECSEGYFIYNNNCVLVSISNCVVYSDLFTCSQCESDFLLIGNACFQKLLNLVNCSAASDLLKCIACDDSFYLDSQNICTSNPTTDSDVITHCVSYFMKDGVLKCSKCETESDTYAIDGKCVVVNDPNCLSYLDPSTCNKCNNSFLFNGYCQFPTTDVTFCNSYISDGQCQECAQNFKLLNNKCVPIYIQYCIEYININNCSKCTSGYYTYNGVCTPIVSHVQNCEMYNSNDGFCKSCLQGFFLSDSGECLVPDQIIDNCVNYNSDQFCMSCLQGFTLSVDSQTCQIVLPLIPNCYYYGKVGSCLECEEEFFVNDSNLCSRVLEPILNCRVHTSLAICRKCHMGFVLDSSVTPSTCNFLTNNFIPNCLKYTNIAGVLNCVECMSNSYINNGVCLITAVIINCVRVLSPGTCSECQDGYVLFNSSCVVGQISSCMIYNSVNNCKMCIQGFYLSDDQTSCINLDSYVFIDNCVMYSSPNECLLFLPNSAFYKNSDGALIPSFPDNGVNCQTTKRNGSTISCYSCMPGLENVAGACNIIVSDFLEDIAVDDQGVCINGKGGSGCSQLSLALNCVATSSLNNIECIVCQNGYFLIDGECNPIVTSNNCISVDISDNCLTCKGGYYLKDGACIPLFDVTLLNNCLSVTNDFQCSSCLNFHFVINDRCQRVESGSEINNCVSYLNGNTCNRCSSDYYNSSDCSIVVADPIEHCFAYTNNSCQKCSSEYFLQNGKCYPIFSSSYVSNCKHYNTHSVCIECEGGYFLQNALPYNVSCVPYINTPCLIGQSPSSCTMCGGGFKLRDGLCLTLIPNLNNCENYNSKLRTCVKCLASYYLNTSGGINSCIARTSFIECLLGDTTTDSCLVCKNGYALSSGKCLFATDTPINCLSINVNNKCLNCVPGFKLTNDLLCKTINLPDNCLYVSDYGVCASCQTPMLDDGTCSTTKTDPNCISYSNKNICKICNVGFHVNQMGFCQNTDLIDDCQIYGESNKCLICSQGMYFDITTYKCTSVIMLGCILFTDPKTCYLCSETYQLVEGTCINAETDSNCLVFDPDSSCQQCKPNYAILPQESNNCSPLPNSTLVLNCDLYRGPNDCVSCKELFYLEHSSKCSPNPFGNLAIPNCRKYLGTSICSQCNGNNFIKNNICQTNPKEIINCISYLNQFTCRMCSSGFYPFENICIRVSTLIDNCLLYLSDSECAVCKLNYLLTEGKCVKIESPIENCLEYTSQTVCSKCSQQFYFDSVNRICKQVTIPGCLFYVDSTKCSYCQHPYIISNYTCLMPITVDSNCTHYISMTSCKTCADKYFIDSLGKCVKSNDENCKTPSTSSICLVCMQGFYLTSEKKCSTADTIANCVLHSSASKCSLCATGYLLSVDGQSCSVFSASPNCSNGQVLSSPVCSKCILGYNPLKGVCTVVEFPELMAGCAYDSPNGSKCMACVPGYTHPADFICV